MDFVRLVLKLDPRQVYEDLGSDAEMLCWESPGKFRHRHLVAEWLEKALDIKVPEKISF
ncbi:hypothetical protein [Syntrophus gentianae]|uniref:hypothetical protein n=1 Tax=Syntrophus gentianae TaxID=43775 RepID=UPI001587068B|nr:hypothetical protein [Syntrophus gentianae]